jgi:hypothetical protein
MLLKWCRSGAAMVLHWYHNSVTLVGRDSVHLCDGAGAGAGDGYEDGDGGSDNDDSGDGDGDSVTTCLNGVDNGDS